MRKLSATVILLCVVLSGCSGAVQPANETAQERAALNDTADNATQRTAVPLDEATYPPGLSDSGIKDREALLDAHRAAVSETDYTLSAYHSYFGRYSDGERQYFEEWWRAKSDRDDRRVIVTINETGITGYGANLSRTVYTSGDRHYQRSNWYTKITYTTEPVRRPVGQLHNSTLSFNATINQTLAIASLTPVEAVTDGDDTFVRFRITFPARDSAGGSLLVRDDGLVTEIRAEDEDEDVYGLDDEDRLNDGIDRYRLEPKDDVTVREITWKDKARREVREQLREGATVDVSGIGCTNDGDPSYDEDNDRDNDGRCDEG